MRSTLRTALVCLAAGLLATHAAATPRAGARLRLDPTFGNGGMLRLAGIGTERLDEFTLVRGRMFSRDVWIAGSRPGPAVVRLANDGSPVAAFGSGGIAVLPFGGQISGMDVGSGIVLSGTFSNAADPSTLYGAVRLLEDGSVDPAFGTGGRMSIMDGANPLADRLYELRRLQDGSYAALATRTAATPAFGLVHFSADGELDRAFGGDGFADIETTSGDAAKAMDVDAQGRFVVSIGREVQRYAPDGTRDTLFDVLRGVRGLPVNGEQVAIDPAGRIVVVGSEGNRTRGVLRFSADGVPDATWFRRGRASVPWHLPGSLYAQIGNLRLTVPSEPSPNDGSDEMAFVYAAVHFVEPAPPHRPTGAGSFATLLDGGSDRALAWARRESGPQGADRVELLGAAFVMERVFVVGRTASDKSGGGEFASPVVLAFRAVTD